MAFAAEMKNEHPNQNRHANLFARARFRSVFAILILGLVLFVAAGDLGWWPGWAYMAILVISMILPLYGPLQFEEGLIEERMSPKADAKAWDKHFVRLVGVLTIAELIVPGLDHRWGWTESLPVWISALGLLLAIFGTAGLIWAMRTNRFFSTVIRIQKDRDHVVVSKGPYNIVRHPGYAFWSLRTIGVPLLFGSKWTLIVAGLFIAMFVVRTVLEDRVLLKELAGYREYAVRVKWRLIKGIW
jgi:protein-S-isoprenylcysteine O-methyltransferase Ste14